MPIVVSLVPWFTLLAVIALVCAIVSKRTVSIVMAVLAIALQAFWQYPFFYQPSKLPRAAVAAASGETVNTDDGYARLMTCNVYKGRADAREIVDLVRSEHVEVLALQETTDAFVDDLNRAGIASYLPMRRCRVRTACTATAFGRRVRLTTLPMTMSIRARRSCRAAPFRSMGEPRRCVSYPCIPRRRRTITGSSGSGRSTNWRNYVSTLADGTFSWVISTRRTTIRRSATFWETVSPTLPSGRRGIEILMACECRLRAVVRRNRPYRTGFRHAGRTGAHSQSGRQRPQSAAGDCAGRLSPWLDGDDRHVIRISDAGDDVRALRFCGQHRHGELVEQLVGERSGQLSYRIRVRQPFHNREIWYVLHADPLVFQR